MDMEYGMTYMVRPFMHPVYSLVSLARHSAGSIQLLMFPASSLVLVQMKVRPSTRATSSQVVRCR